MNGFFDSAEFAFLDFELDGCVPRCNLSDLDKSLVEKLTALYEKNPFKITSAYRSVEYELSKHRPGTSSHCKGLAVDVYAPNGLTKLHIVRDALNVGFQRIGIGSNFIHLDVDIDKPKSIWTY